MRHKTRRLMLSCLAMFAIASTCFIWFTPLTPVSAQQPSQDRATNPPYTSITKSGVTLRRLSSATQAVAAAGGEQGVMVRVEADRAVDLSAVAGRGFLVGERALGEKIYLAQVRASLLEKLASLPGVQRVEMVDHSMATAAPAIDPERRPLPSLAERRERLKALRALDQGWNASQATAGVFRAEDWYDIREGHGTQNAWAKGYQGQGVKVAVIDSGADMGHPDLVGTWARVTDPQSPYYGWPMAFDPYSMLLYVADYTLGSNFIATGDAWYVDTSATPATYRNAGDEAAGRVRLKFAPFADSFGRGGREPGDEHEYTLPARSQSGVYHIGNHPDRVLAQDNEEHVAVLLVDEHTAGVYDTVYVDLDGDHDFTDEKPVTRESPASYRDLDADGLADLSGGMVYFIADGQHAIPGITTLFSESAAPPPAKASLVAFMGDFDLEAGFHGTLCSSAVVGQGRTSGLVPRFSDLTPRDQPASADLGAAPLAGLVPVGNTYMNFEVSTRDAYYLTLFGYDGQAGTDDDIQIPSNSYGRSEVDNDGWDYLSRWIDRYVREKNPTVAYLNSTGNGGPGYGTDTPNGPEVGIAVGASTMFGTTGYDSITRTTQIQYGDTTSFSNRGLTARGQVGVDVVANGDRGAGATQLNRVGDGATAWETWGGTSRSTPVTAGNLALVYQAFKAGHGRWPTYEEARALLKSGATPTGADTLSEGAGAVNADYATDIASGRQGVLAMPDEWRAGDYRGREYPGFANIIYPGQSDTQSFRLSNPGDAAVEVNLAARTLRRFDSRIIPFFSAAASAESQYNFNAPDYLIPVGAIPQGTDLMVVSANFSLGQLDAGRDYQEDQTWRLLLYDWTDINGDGKLWEDRDGDGVVDHANLLPTRSSNIDGFPDLDWSRSEIQRWEYVRVMYNNSVNNTLRVQMHSPHGRMHDGLFIGLQHNNRAQAIPRTQMQIRLDFFRYEDWPWVRFGQTRLTIDPHSTVTATATLTIPADTPPGAYQGALYATYGGRAPYTLFLPHISRAPGRGEAGKTGGGGAASVYPDRQARIPVVANVATRYDFQTSATLGGRAANDPNAPYNNGALAGYMNWAWREEAGDWRLFFLDTPSTVAEGAAWLVRNVWPGQDQTSDIDTLLLGPTSDPFSDPGHPDNSPPNSNLADPDFYGPYTLDVVGKSLNENMSQGRWRFQTATEGPDEWIAGPAREGLHAVLLHNVLHPGLPASLPFTTTVGAMTVSPPAFDITATVTAGDVVSGCAPLALRANLDLPGLTVEAFGLSQPERVQATARQDDPNNRSTASYKRQFSVDHAVSISLTLDGGRGPDLDLYLVYDANRDGQFTTNEIVARSISITAQESILVRRPPDGQYQVWVHGYDVPGGSAPFTLDLDIVQGNDIVVRGVPSGPVTANTPLTLQVCYQHALAPGQTVRGQVLLGPTVAPSVLTVPLHIRRAP